MVSTAIATELTTAIRGAGPLMAAQRGWWWQRWQPGGCGGSGPRHGHDGGTTKRH
jgi:hypothetical protein